MCVCVCLCVYVCACVREREREREREKERGDDQVTGYWKDEKETWKTTSRRVRCSVMSDSLQPHGQ